ncbi:MAG: aminotransferase class V-fold PLP-dependent enzyme [Anaerolineales bacterium]|nr:aminotransferase class V-fold PLP-dependent enzyme [Anaerolineales bacterium]
MFNLKKDFLLDPSVTFLNHGSFGATPKPVFKEYQRWQRELENQPVEFLGRRHNDLMLVSRLALAKYLGTKAENLVYVQNATIGLNIVARSLKLSEGDEVLSTNHEYGALDRTWRFLAKENGFTYLNQKVELTSHADFVKSFLQGVTANTKVIFLSHIASSTATIFPLEKIIQFAKSKNIITVIDGAHAPGQIDLNLDSLNVDFYAGNLHKWLCAPKGAGFLYASPKVQHLLKPLIVSWGYESESPSNSKFVDEHEGQGTRDIAAFLTVPKAIAYQQEQDWVKVRGACHQLAVEAWHRIHELTKMTPLHASRDPETWFAQMTVSSLPINTDVVSLRHRLYDEFRIEIPLIDWHGNKLIRTSVQGYNSRSDINRLIQALKKLIN